MMKYFKDIDYFLFFEDFPHMGIPGAIALNSDDTVNIFINTLYNPAVQARTVRHELRHMAYGHFHSDWMTITEKEVEADSEDDPNCIFADDFSWVEYTGQERRPPNPSIGYSELQETLEREARNLGASHISLSLPPKLRFTPGEVEGYLIQVRQALSIATKNRLRPLGAGQTINL